MSQMHRTLTEIELGRQRQLNQYLHVQPARRAEPGIGPSLCFLLGIAVGLLLAPFVGALL